MLRVAALVLSIAFLAGCQPSQPPQEGASVEDTVAAPAPATPATDATAVGEREEEQAHAPTDVNARDTTEVDASVVSVRLSNQGDTEANFVGPAMTRFAPEDTVYAEVETTGTADSYTVYAKWTASDGSVLADYGIHVGQRGMQRTVLSLSKPDGWSSGKNKIELAINGEIERTVNFEVQ
jgi:hypothetical protein